ncbi:MAG: hypothetical protein ABIS37_04485 [Bacteroidia bacterium]
MLKSLLRLQDGVYITLLEFYLWYAIMKMWKRKKVQPSLTSGALLGAASGLNGIHAWKSIFEIHCDSPEKNLKTFFGHLLLGLLIFGVFSALTYKLTSDRNS